MRSATALPIAVAFNCVRAIGLWCNVLYYGQRYAHLPRHAKKAKKALKKLRTLAGRQLRDLQRQLAKLGKQELYAPLVQTMERIVGQQRGDRNKVYSLHAPETSCIAKGEAHKKHELGSKVSVASLSGSNVVVGITNSSGNPPCDVAPFLSRDSRVPIGHFSHLKWCFTP